MKIAVIGTGYVGLVTAAVLADMGNDVTCVDNDPAKIQKLKAGVSPIYEPGIEELLKKGLDEGFLQVSNDIAEATKQAEIVFIAVGTPPGPDGFPDMTQVKSVATEIGKCISPSSCAQEEGGRGVEVPDSLRETPPNPPETPPINPQSTIHNPQSPPPKIVVNKSTVPVGSAGLVEKTILEQGADPRLFHVVSNPEFLREGSAIQDTRSPDRIVIGAKSPEAAAKLRELYAPLGSEVLVTDLESAELVKYASNSFLAMKISFINAISRICELTGANVEDVARGLGLDSRIGPQFLGAGLGWGGSCFPKDVQGLIGTAARLGYDFRLLQEVAAINQDQTLHALSRLEQALGGFAGKTIGLMGLSFKPNTDDIRDAKSLVVIEQVLSKGGRIRAYDPISGPKVLEYLSQPSILQHFNTSILAGTHPSPITHHLFELVPSVYDVADAADALFLVTEWNEFRQLDLSRLASCMKRKLLFDGRRVYKRASAEKAGFEYLTVGS